MANDLDVTDRVDLNLFRVFDTVYRAGSLTQAAAALHLTQPAVSNALARLRAQFDDPLFVRDGRRVVPTPRAKAIAPRVGAALAALRGTLHRSAQFEPAASDRRFIIGMRDLLEFALLPPLLGELQRTAPRAQLHSVRVERRQMARELAAGRLDLVIDIPLPVAEDIHQQPLLRAELCLAMRSGHALAAKPLTIKSWLAAPHVVVSARPSGPVLEDFELQRRGLARQVSVRCQHYYAACHLVATSDLVLVLPRYYGEWFAAHLPLHLAALPIPLPALDVSLYWHRNAESDPANAWLRERILALSALQVPAVARRGRSAGRGRARPAPG